MSRVVDRLAVNLGAVAVCLLAFRVAPSWAYEPPEKCSGWLYRSKKHEVAVFEEPDRASRVLEYLSRGDEVCYVGERERFAIVEWTVEKQAYVRLVDLWPGPLSDYAKEKLSKSGKPMPNPTEYGLMGIIKRVKRYFTYMRSGGVPDNALDAYEPIIGIPEAVVRGSCTDNCADDEAAGASTGSKSQSPE